MAEIRWTGGGASPSALDPGNYEGGALPKAGDVIVLEPGFTTTDGDRLPGGVSVMLRDPMPGVFVIGDNPHLPADEPITVGPK
jgi:hypothetical protein